MDTANFDELFGENGNPTKEQLELSDKLSELLTQISDSYNNAYNIAERLEFDDALIDEFQTTAAMITVMEASEENHDDDKMVEDGYLKLIDCLIRMAKVLNPVSGFGKERLLSAYEVLDTFEEIYHPLLTVVNKDNVDAFADLLSDREYDEIFYERKKAIGALRTEEGEAYAAGVAVYRTETAPVLNNPVIRLDYIYVHEDFRSHGIANLLMAAVVRPMLKDPASRLSLSYMPQGTTEEYSDAYAQAIEDEFDSTEEFFSSWKLSFSLSFGNNYYISLEDAAKAKYMQGSTKGIVSLKQLGNTRETVLRKFLAKYNDPYYKDFLSAPDGYYDEDVSCAYLDGKEIYSILLSHRYLDGTYTIDFLCPDLEDEMVLSDSVTRLLHFATDACTERGETDSMIEIHTASEEGYSLLRKELPGAKTALVFDGILAPLVPEETLSTEQWESLRDEAELTGKYSYDENAFSSLSEEEITDSIKEHLNSYM